MKRSLLLVSLLGLLAGTPAFSATWISGHGDVGIAYDDTTDEWEPHYHFGEHEEEGGEPHGEEEEEAVIIGGVEGQEEYEIDELTVQVLGPPQPSAGVSISGAESVFLLAQDEGDAEALNSPYMGFSAEEEVPTGVFVDDTVTISLLGVTGPSGGVFSVWDIGGLGESVPVMSSLNPSGTDSFDLIAGGSHAHFNIGFSELGAYDVLLRVEGVLDDGSSTVTGQDFTMSFSVVPEPSALSLALLGAVGLLRRKR